jgi:hypothetical protein
VRKARGDSGFQRLDQFSIDLAGAVGLDGTGSEADLEWRALSVLVIADRQEMWFKGL